MAWPGTDWISPVGVGGSIRWHSAGHSAHPEVMSRFRCPRTKTEMSAAANEETTIRDC